MERIVHDAIPKLHKKGGRAFKCVINISRSVVAGDDVPFVSLVFEVGERRR